ncbi:MAG: FAD binding domain-containing protein, partial [Alphaproteobacteria bacterium]
MHSFDYLRPATLEEATRLFHENADAKFLAGGQTLIPTLKQRLAQPSALIDRPRMSGLAGVMATAAGNSIGAAPRPADVAGAPDVK